MRALRQRRTGQRSGFTLVEVMVTLLIVGIIMVSVAEILRGARYTRDSIHNIQEKELAGPLILQTIENDLRSLIIYDRDPRFSIRISNRISAGFDADSIDFVSSSDSLLPYRENSGQAFRRADVNEVGYCLRPNPDSDDFLEIYRREDFGVDTDPFEGGRYALLHDRVKGFDVRIYDEDGLEAEPVESWGSSFDEFTGLPSRIEFELTLELAPRLVREQLLIESRERRTVTYTRVFRFPPSLHLAQETSARPVIPRIEKPKPPTPPGGPPAGEPPPGDPPPGDPPPGDPPPPAK